MQLDQIQKTGCARNSFDTFIDENADFQDPRRQPPGQLLCGFRRH